MAFKTGIKIPSVPKTPREVTRNETQGFKPPKIKLPRAVPKIRVRPPKFKLLPNIRGTGGL